MSRSTELILGVLATALISGCDLPDKQFVKDECETLVNQAVDRCVFDYETQVLPQLEQVCSDQTDALKKELDDLKVQLQWEQDTRFRIIGCVPVNDFIGWDCRQTEMCAPPQ